MNIRAIANSVASTINPNTPVSILRSNGYSIGAGARQVPSYAAPVSGYAQVQALDGADLQQIENINQQGTYRVLYLTGALHGVIRPDGTGGDLVQIGVEKWLVVKVLETWPTWTKAAICRQDN